VTIDEETLPAVSLYQPYASLVAAGLKPIETRPARIHYRGDMVICAAQKIDTEAAFYTVAPRLTTEQRAALERVGCAFDKAGDFCQFPVGAVALVDVVGCRPLVPEDEPLAWAYGPNRWAWLLENIRPLRPFPVRGMPGRFKVSKRMVMEAVR